jgi:hypothetical protein
LPAAWKSWEDGSARFRTHRYHYVECYPIGETPLIGRQYGEAVLGKVSVKGEGQANI